MRSSSLNLTDNILDIPLKARPLRDLARLDARVLAPSVMNPGTPVRLGPGTAPAVIEQNKHGKNACLIRELQKRIDPRFKSRRICLPREIMQINTDAIHTHFGGPASSRSMVAGSKVSACHISSLQAVLGMKLQPITRAEFGPRPVRAVRPSLRMHLNDSRHIQILKAKGRSVPRWNQLLAAVVSQPAPAPRHCSY